jgi:hypothetical protein
MKCAALVLASLAAITGVVAARKWYVPSRVNFVPFEEVGGRIVEVPTEDVRVWINSLRLALNRSGRLEH